MLFSLLALITAVLGGSTASTLGSIKSDNGTLYITSATTGAVIINEINYVETITTLQDAVAALQSLTLQQAAAIQTLLSTTSTHSDSIGALQTLTDLQGSNIQALQSLTTAHSANIATLVANVASNTAAITGLTAADGSQNSSIASLQTSASIASSNIATLFSKVATLNATEITQGNSITTVQSNVATLQTTVNNQGANITTLFATTATTNNGLATTNSNLASVNTTLNANLNALSASTTSSINGLTASATSFSASTSTSLTGLSTSIAAVNTSLQADINYPVLPALGTVACTSSNVGAIRLNGSTILLCVTGSSWIPVNPNIGSSINYPATSCAQVVSVAGTNVNGVYWITQTGGSIIQQACVGSTNYGGNGTSALASSASCSALQTYFAATAGMYYVGGTSVSVNWHASLYLSNTKQALFLPEHCLVPGWPYFDLRPAIRRLHTHGQRQLIPVVVPALQRGNVHAADEARRHKNNFPVHQLLLDFADSLQYWRLQHRN